MHQQGHITQKKKAKCKHENRLLVCTHWEMGTRTGAPKAKQKKKSTKECELCLECFRLVQTNVNIDRIKGW